MATIDPTIALATRPPQIDNSLDVYGKGMQLQHLANQNQMNQLAMQKNARDLEQERTLADLYRGAVGPDGKVNRTRLMSGAADAGLGSRIPGLQKSFLENDNTTSQINERDSITGKNKLEILHKGLQMVDGSIASMLADPDIDDRKVAGEMGRLVRLGAFDAQAEHMKVTPDEAAKQVMSTMPVGNPGALRSWLVQAGMRTADASKRLEIALPKYDEQNRGGTIDEGTINQMTGVRTGGNASQILTNTPGEVLSSETIRRGQDKTDARGREMAGIAREANAINKEGQRTQLVETPDGYMRVDKGTGVATPVQNPAGGQVLPAKSELAADRKMATQMKGMIDEGRKLLAAGPTASGTGAFIDKIVQVTGLPVPKSTTLAASLDTLGGWMTSNVPRMQGPQSNADTLLYRQMGGIVGDRTKSIEERVAALDQVQKIMERQAQYTGGTPFAKPVDKNKSAAPVDSSTGLPPLDSFYTK